MRLLTLTEELWGKNRDALKGIFWVSFAVWYTMLNVVLQISLRNLQ